MKLGATANVPTDLTSVVPHEVQGFPHVEASDRIDQAFFLRCRMMTLHMFGKNSGAILFNHQ